MWNLYALNLINFLTARRIKRRVKYLLHVIFAHIMTQIDNPHFSLKLEKVLSLVILMDSNEKSNDQSKK